MRRLLVVAALAACSRRGAAPAAIPAQPPPVRSTGCPPALIETAAGPAPALLAAMFGEPYYTSFALDRIIDDPALAAGWYVTFGAEGDFIGRVRATAAIVRATDATPESHGDDSLVARWAIGGVPHVLTTPAFDLAIASYRCAVGPDEPRTFAAARRVHPALAPPWLPETLRQALDEASLRGAQVDQGIDSGRSLYLRVEAPPGLVDQSADDLVAEGFTDVNVDGERRLTSGGLSVTLRAAPDGGEVWVSVSELGEGR